MMMEFSEEALREWGEACQGFAELEKTGLLDRFFVAFDLEDDDE
jgi:hypothetical protein